jgi:Tfp pilus assembly protein PilN
MIKINLLKSFGSNSSEVLQQMEEQKGAQALFIKKFVVMMLGVLAMFGYEQYMIPKLNEEKTKLQAEFSELSAFNQKKEALKLEIEKYEKDRIRLNRQTDFLQKIQRERMLPVTLLAKIKELIPPNLWLTNLKIDGSRLEITGEADSDNEVNDFNLKLSSLNFLKDVVVISINLKAPDSIITVPIKVFSMKAVLFESENQTVVK